MTPRRFRLAVALILIAGALALVVLTVSAPPPALVWRAAPPQNVQLAFWTFFVALVGLIWKGLEVAGRITLQALAWSVKALWAFAGAVSNAVKAVGKAFALAGKEIWQFMRHTLGRAIVDGWKKFWHLVDRFRNWLERSFKPVLKFLFKLRDRLMKFYTKWIRPVLDLIDIGRKTARVLGALGIEWAKALDRKLMEIQEAIDRPFRAVLAKVNEVIGIVNRIVTADGLFQRLALIRSIERDLQIIADEFAAARERPLTDKDHEARRALATKLTIEQVSSNTEEYFGRASGPYAARVDEITLLMQRHLR